MMPRPDARYPEPHERDAARRLLEHDHAAEHLAGAPAREANQHAQAIDEEHPRARDIAMTGTARELGRLPRHLARHQRTMRERAAITTEHAARIRATYRAAPHTEPDQREELAPADNARRGRRTQTARGQLAAGASATGRALAHGADAAVDTGWGQLIGQGILTAFALSLLYLFLTRAAAAGKLFQGATNVARAVVSPVIDPLNPKGALR